VHKKNWVARGRKEERKKERKGDDTNVFWGGVFLFILGFFLSVVFNNLQMQNSKKKKNAERDRLLWRAGKLW
jgi:hypothetical protein